ncbi:glycosyltransferase [Cryobacterium sp. PAMC25264]|uniref:glycosyltransferase n=1 Tax=Cryobacterium sp. PAMC25264 TaxID=2861288 RepID=UPI001C63622B|nr:glycosyltransferase [Cryobacterium sp. PAMC25264]QYF72837.1 glycosyltransferase [Cryobacterium sp. PAMC25264]
MRLVRPGPAAGPASVTVVIPCYNYGHFLPELVASVLAQRDVRTHVIIVDDASPDGSGDVAARLAEENSPRVSAIIHAHNRGHIQTYNDGLAAVDTEYVTLVSADDVVAPGALGRATRLMDRFPGVGLVYGHASVFHDNPVPRHRPLPETWSVWNGRDWIDWTASSGRNLIVSPEAVMRTRALRETGGYNPELPHSGDLEFWLRAAARWDVARVNGRPQAFYRMHGENMHLTQFATMAVDMRHRLTAFEVLTGPELAPLVPGSDRLIVRTRQAIARQANILAARELDRGAHRGEVQELLALAEELSPGSSSARRISWRVSRDSRGKTPASRQRMIERGRTQLDRVRGVLSEIAGIA